MARIPTDRWREALAFTDPFARRQAASLAESDFPLMARLLYEVDMEDANRRERANEAAMFPEPLPAIDTSRPARSTRQVNFRLGPRDYGLLESAADLLGVKPTLAARILVNRATRQVVREAEQGDPPDPA